MAKKDKNSLLNIHYSRTLTSDNLSKAANYVGEYILKGLGAFGKFLNAGFTSPTYGTTGQVSYARNAEDARRQRKLYESSELAAGKAMTWVSPLNYGAALATGNGLNARKGEEEVASWSPAWLAAARLGELYVGPKAVKGVKATPRVVVNTAAKAGVKPAKAAVVAREINKGIKQNTNNGRIEVTGNYFNSPDKWYRITETPEKYGIMELGKNVTTHDAPQTHGTINGWRSSMLKAPITKSSEGFIKRPQKIELGIRRKNGQAHGNTSQAAKGKLWGGTTSGSRLFPEGIIEGQAPSMINYGIDRTNFVMTPWEEVPNGGRVGFYTGEMPMSNLGWFQRTNKGTYTYEPIISEKRINFTPTKLLEPSKTSSTIQISPEELYKVLKGQELNGYYFMGHGTGRTGVNPQTIFDNGLRVKGGDIGNTTMPISESNLTSWPHMNSEEIILMPGKATMTKYDSAHGHIPSDWYSSDVFHWTDNPKKVGSGPFAAFEPNASFTEQTIGGVPGVYTKPEAVLGSYNTKTHTLKLNPKSLYEFLFNVPKLAEPRTSLKFFERKPAKKPLSQAERQGMTKGDRNLPEPSFRSELNWSSKDWFEKTAGRKYKDGSLTQYTDEDIKELISHIPEYLEIEARSKKNGTWLKMEDGSNWYGDSRSWVLMLSKNLKLHNPEDFWTGVHNSENFLEINSVNPEYNGKIWGVYGQKFLSAAKARTYAPNDNLVFHMVSSKKTPTVVYDALGRPWYDIGGLKVGDQYIAGRTTDEIIDDNFSKGIGRIKINDVSDTGPNKIKTNSKYSTGDFMLDWETLNSPGVHQNDIILSPGSFRKSLLGNNGAFSYKNKNIYRGLIPLTTGYTLYNLFNQPLQQLQYLK